MSLDGDASGVRQWALRQLAVKRDWERRFSGFASLVVIPASFGVLGAFSSDWDKTIGALPVFGMWTVLIILLGVFAVRLNPTGESLLSLAVENEALEAKLAAS